MPVIVCLAPPPTLQHMEEIREPCTAGIRDTEIRLDFGVNNGRRFGSVLGVKTLLTIFFLHKSNYSNTVSTMY